MYRGDGRQMTEGAFSIFRYTLKDGNLNMQDFEKYILGRKSSLELGREQEVPWLGQFVWSKYRASNVRQRSLDFAGQCWDLLQV